MLLTEMEHHSNLVPWQMLAAEKGIRLEFIPVTTEGLLDLEIYENYLKTIQNWFLLRICRMFLGTINPAKEIIHLAHQAGAITIVDGAQSVPHIPSGCTRFGCRFSGFFSA